MEKNILILLLAAIVNFACAETTPKNDWPAGCSPQEIGVRVAQRFVSSPHASFNTNKPAAFIIYPETCTWHGALTFAKLTGDTNLTGQLVKRFEPLFGSEKSLIPKPVNVDTTVFAAVPLELYLQTKDSRYLEIGQALADRQWEKPANTNKLDAVALAALTDGLTFQTRYWIDDMYMITMVQAQAYRATGDAKYIDRAAREMVAYLDKLQQPNGLFFHAPDVPFYWGRGNGWFAAGMSELLVSLPENHPDRARIMAGYQKMMAALIQYQDAYGYWRQLVDQPDSWPESSCTGMFTFALIAGVKNGWLDETTYNPAARKGWLALVKFINSESDVTEVCEGTNKKNDRQYYLDRKRKVGDMHGQAPVLWCASAWLRPSLTKAKDTALQSAKATSIPFSPAVLPGNGLAQHPFLYTGEWDTRKPDEQSIFIVRDGKIVWQYYIPFKAARGGIQEFDDVTMLPDGNILFSRMSGAGIISPDKKILWNYDAPVGTEVHSAQFLGHNRVLIMRNGNPAQAMIFNTASNTLEKELKIPTTVTKTHLQFRHIRMTPTGTILVPHMSEGKVVEYSLDGKEVWSVKAASVWAAVRLKNGNTLLSGDSKGYVREVNPKGETVWEFTQKDVPDIKIFNIQEACRLANGNTVICNWCANGVKNKADWPTTVQVLEVTPEKKLVWALRSWNEPNDLGTSTSIQLLDEPPDVDALDAQR